MARIYQNFTMSHVEATRFNGENLNLTNFGEIAGKTVEITFNMYQTTETPKIHINILRVHILED